MYVPDRAFFHVTLFSDTHTLNLSILILNFQCKGAAKERRIKRAQGLTTYDGLLRTLFSLILEYNSINGSECAALNLSYPIIESSEQNNQE